MKNLPIGIQTFPKLIETNCIYVDKTQLIFHLVTKGSYYFLSRPRRFGKSLLISTLKELFEGNKTLFEGLWIENNWDWSQKHPVLHFSFDSMSVDQTGLKEAILLRLQDLAAQFEISFGTADYKNQFRELIEKTAEKHGKVVLLVDEYDKPIIDYLDESSIARAKANRDVLREFYGVLKSADENLRLVFLTGISKFSKVSIFSHLNNLDDITFDRNYATLTGYTQEELEANFDDYLREIEQRMNVSRQELLDNMRLWYNGYSWDGESRLYNPFGTLNFLSKKQFLNFWFASGSPRFLVEQMRKQVWYNVENVEVNNVIFERYDLDNVELVPLLFQTGYLTVKSADIWTGEFVLDYPNKEVRESMYQFLIADLAPNPARTNTGRTMRDLREAFHSGNLEQVRYIINSMLADLPSEVFLKQYEGLYHGLVHLIFNYLGMYAQSEVHSSQGRADAVVQTPTDVYIFEFKFNKTAQEALDQILKRDYAVRYRSSGKTITGIGVNFDPAGKQIDDWVERVL